MTERAALEKELAEKEQMLSSEAKLRLHMSSQLSSNSTYVRDHVFLTSLLTAVSCLLCGGGIGCGIVDDQVNLVDLWSTSTSSDVHF